MDIYREEILDHYKYPRNFGHLDHASARHEEHNTSCGDRISMELVYDKAGKVADIRFSGEGCAISIASASMLTEKVKGIPKRSAVKLTPEDIIAMLGVTLMPTRLKCALLPLEVLQKTIRGK